MARERDGVPVNVNVQVCLIHYLLSNQFLNNIFQGDNPTQLRFSCFICLAIHKRKVTWKRREIGDGYTSHLQ